MYVITAHQRHGRTDGQTDVKRSHDRYIAKACSGKNHFIADLLLHVLIFLNIIICGKYVDKSAVYVYCFSSHTARSTLCI